MKKSGSRNIAKYLPGGAVLLLFVSAPGGYFFQNFLRARSEPRLVGDEGFQVCKLLNGTSAGYIPNVYDTITLPFEERPELWDWGRRVRKPHRPDWTVTPASVLTDDSAEMVVKDKTGCWLLVTDNVRDGGRAPFQVCSVEPEEGQKLLDFKAKMLTPPLKFCPKGSLPACPDRVRGYQIDSNARVIYRKGRVEAFMLFFDKEQLSAKSFRDATLKLVDNREDSCVYEEEIATDPHETLDSRGQLEAKRQLQYQDHRGVFTFGLWSLGKGPYLAAVEPQISDAQALRF